MIEEYAPSFPIYVTGPVWAAILVWVLICASRLGDASSAFLLLATWFRYCIATFHEYTYPPFLFGFSLIALTSIVIIMLGFVVVGTRALHLRLLAPLYGMVGIVLLSTMANQTWLGGMNAAFKWLFLIVFALAAYRAMRHHGSERIFGAIAGIFAGPIVLQWISVPWGLKTTTSDGLSFFIGGYQHQQGLSIILLTFLVVTCLSTQLGAIFTFYRVVIVAVGLVMANYRTALVAAGLPAASLVISRLVNKVILSQRVIAFLLACVVAVFALAAVAVPQRERFVDLGAMVDKGTSLIKPSRYFTPDDRRLLSSRLYLWSQYIESYLDGDARNIVVGFGPEAWVGNFTTYAHNTFISYLFELGLFGVAGLCWLFAWNLSLAIRVNRERRLILVSCHVAFVVLNLSTMALWTLEGAMLYGLILGYTWYVRSVDRSRLDSAGRSFNLPLGRVVRAELEFSNKGNNHLDRRSRLELER